MSSSFPVSGSTHGRGTQWPPHSKPPVITALVKVVDEAIRNNVPYFAELPHIHDVEIVEFPTGQWPQFSKPEELAAHILAAL